VEQRPLYLSDSPAQPVTNSAEWRAQDANCEALRLKPFFGNRCPCYRERYQRLLQCTPGRSGPTPRRQWLSRRGAV